MEVKQKEIPKIIHYCWFGGNQIPAELQDCIDSWSKLEGYKIIEWNESNCTFDENEFVKKTYKEKKWGFIGDYYRLKAVYNYGGIYLDTDVKVFKNFTSLLKNEAFINFIFDCSIGTAVIGAKKGNIFIKNLIDMYDRSIIEKTKNNKPLIEKDGFIITNGFITSNYYFTYYILKNYPNFLLNNREQKTEDFTIYPKELFEIGSLLGKHYTIHYCSGTWKPSIENKKTIKNKIKKILLKNLFLYNKMQIIVRKIRYKKLNKNIPFYSYSLAQKKKQRLPEL